MRAEVLSRVQLITHITNLIWNNSIERTVVFVLGDLQIQLLNRLNLIARLDGRSHRN